MGSDLVQKRERLRLALEHRPDERAQGRLDLGLDRGRLTQSGDRLDVETPVRAQELERPERERRLLGGRRQVPRAQRAAEDGHPPELLVGL